MATPEEWAERLGTTVMTQEEYIQLNDWQVKQYRKPPESAADRARAAARMLVIMGSSWSREGRHEPSTPALFAHPALKMTNVEGNKLIDYH